MNGFEMLIEEMGHIIRPVFQQAVDVVLPVYKQIVKQQNDAAAHLAMSLQSQRESYDRYQMRRWLSQVPHGAIIDGVAYLVVYNEEAPERSYLIVEVVE